jgi:hypothetical protein
MSVLIFSLCFQVKIALDWLEGPRIEYRRFAAVLILKVSFIITTFWLNSLILKVSFIIPRIHFLVGIVFFFLHIFWNLFNKKLFQQ